MQARLEQAGIGHESLRVFGSVMLNVHVVCTGRGTADKWAALLAQVFPGTKIYVGEHHWPAKENRNTSLRPTMRKGWLICARG